MKNSIKKVSVPKSNRHNHIKHIAFYGSADLGQDDPVYQEAFEAAKHVARRKKIIVNGGGPGIMEAATLGAKAAGGKTIGVTFYPEDMPEFEGRDEGNIVKLKLAIILSACLV